MQTRAIVFTATDTVEVLPVILPEPGPREIVVEAVFTTISPGTELRCLAGRQAGVRFPFIPGYAMVGRVVSRGSDATLPEGSHVLCRGTDHADRPLAWGGHVGHAVLAEAAAIVLDPAIDLREAALAKLASIAFRGVRVAGTRPHEQVAVVGLGPIGQLAARLHRLAGARVVAADIRADRVEIARAAGVEALVVQHGLAATFATAMPRGADVVVDATGAPTLLAHSIRLARAKPWDDSLTEPARLVVQGSYPDEAPVDYEAAFARELTIHFPRDSQSRDIQTILRLSAEHRLVVRDLLGPPEDPENAPAVYTALRAARPGLVTTMFQWSPAGR
jgi:2-desacetyl-2-hydroxyethyl bacteriochlorophyllide A dehydrogenase